MWQTSQPRSWVRLETALWGVLSQGISDPQQRFGPIGRGSVGAEPTASCRSPPRSRRYPHRQRGKPKPDWVFSSEDAPTLSLGCKERSIQNCTAAWSNSKIVSLDYNVPIFQIYGHFQYYSLWPWSQEADLQGARGAAEVTITARCRSTASLQPPRVGGCSSAQREGVRCATRQVAAPRPHQGLAGVLP